MVAITPGLQAYFQSQPPAAVRAVKSNAGVAEFVSVKEEAFHVYALPLHRNGEPSGALIVVHDTSYINERLKLSLRDSLLTALIQTILITSLAFLLVRTNLTAPLAKTANWLKTLRGDSSETSTALPKGDMFEQIHAEAKHLANALQSARAAAMAEAVLRDSQSAVWTAERLRVSLRKKLGDKPLFVVSNREPYMHVQGKDGNSIEVIVPASGLVTALEPVLLACNGTWIANGSGNADRFVVDANDRIEVPPDRPAYTLRRVWLDKEEEHGYYSGFANEGLWPLCHIAHTRPIFRMEDWNYYQKVNRRFADAVLQEMEKPSPRFCWRRIIISRCFRRW